MYPGYEVELLCEARRHALICSTSHTLLMLLQAFHRRIHLPQYVLITLGWNSRFWWEVEQPNLTCTAEERESVLPYTLAVSDEFFIQEGSRDINNTITPGIVSRGRSMQDSWRELGEECVLITCMHS